MRLQCQGSIAIPRSGSPLPMVLIAHSTVFEPIRKSVTGYVMSPLGAHEFQNVDIAE